MKETLILLLGLALLLILRFIHSNNIKLTLSNFFNIGESLTYYKDSIGIVYNNKKLKISIIILIILILTPHIAAILIDFKNYLNYKIYTPTVFLEYFTPVNLDFSNVKGFINSAWNYNLNSLFIRFYNQILDHGFIKNISLLFFLLLIFFSRKMEKNIYELNTIKYKILKIISAISWLLFIFILWFYVAVFMDWTMYNKVSTFLLTLDKLVINSFLVTLLNYLFISLLLGCVLFYINDTIMKKQVKWERIINSALSILWPMLAFNIILKFICIEPLLNNPIYILTMSMNISVFFVIQGLLSTFLFINIFVLTIYKSGFFMTLKLSLKIMMENLVVLILIISIGLIILFAMDCASAFISTIYSSYLLNQTNYIIYIIDVLWGAVNSYIIILINICIYNFLLDKSKSEKNYISNI